MSLRETKKALRTLHARDAQRKAAEREIRAAEKAAKCLGVAGWLTIIEKDGYITKAERKAVAVLKAIAKEAE